jgi:biotin carboxyl carrier protein
VFGRLVPAVVVAFLSIAAVWQASAQTGERRFHLPSRAEVRTVVVRAAAAVPVLIPTPPAPARVVWEGADIDGDGAPDFANPTGLTPRVHDGYGSGAFGASRDGGSREHAGIDYEAVAGAEVQAPMSGFVTKIGQAYGDDSRLRYVEITNPALKHTARVLYVNPHVEVGQAVALGDAIGRVETLQGRYPGITDHVHLEIAALGGGKRDPGELIVARLERRGSRG